MAHLHPLLLLTLASFPLSSRVLQSYLARNPSSLLNKALTVVHSPTLEGLPEAYSTALPEPYPGDSAEERAGKAGQASPTPGTLPRKRTLPRRSEPKSSVVGFAMHVAAEVGREFIKVFVSSLVSVAETVAVTQGVALCAMSPLLAWTTMNLARTVYGEVWTGHLAALLLAIGLGSWLL